MSGSATLRCHVCGTQLPLDEVIAGIRREEAIRLWLCRGCVERQLELEEELEA